MGIKQGDQYYLPIYIKSDGSPLDVDDVSEVEFVLGKIIKTYPDEVSYDSEEGAFLFPITQEETFAMRDIDVKFDVRVKFKNQSVVGLKPVRTIPMTEALSKEVL